MPDHPAQCDADDHKEHGEGPASTPRLGHWPRPSPPAGSTNPPGDERDEGDSGSRKNPLPIGSTVSNPDWKVTLGKPREAGAEIAAENPFNAPPEAGMEYWIVPVTATYTGDDTGNWFEVDVDFVGSDNRTYDDSRGVIPDSLQDVGERYTDGVATGA